MVWIGAVAGIEGTLNPELSAATTNQLAQRIHTWAGKCKHQARNDE
jgi:hypothetical protein